MDIIVWLTFTSIALFIGYIIGQRLQQRRHNAAALAVTTTTTHLNVNTAAKPSPRPQQTNNNRVDTATTATEDDDDDDDDAEDENASSSGSSTLLAPIGSTPRTPASTRRCLVIVSLTLPIRTTEQADGTWSVTWQDTRSYLSALRSLTKSYGQYDVKWVGIPNNDSGPVPKDRQEAYEELLAEHNCIPVWVLPNLFERFNTGFCRKVLWPLLHYTLPQSTVSFGREWDDSWQAYTAVNTLYATTVTRTVETPTDAVWIHNYHLLLLPSFIRTKLPRAKIGLFIHTSFPSSDVFRILPTRHNILSSIMCTDLIGFHTFDYARHFLSCIKRVMDLDFETQTGGSLGIKWSGRFVSICISHVGIDSHTIQALNTDEDVIQRLHKLQTQFKGRQCILSVEDFDPVRGPLLKLRAIYYFLQTRPERRDRVCFIEMLSPTLSVGSAAKSTATASTDQSNVRTAILAELERIRRDFGDECLHIVEFTNDAQRTQREMVIWYKLCSICLVTSLWDGLNLLPYEYAASQTDSHPGTLILSEFMGCSRTLNGVIRVNPWSMASVSDAINTALSLSLEERKANHLRRYNYVMTHTVDRWAHSFIDQLEKATRLQSSLNYVQVGWGSNVKLMGLRSDFAHLEDDMITVAYRRATRRVLLLDYDGTLTPTDKSVEKSRLVGPTETIKRILRALCEDEDNTVFIMSGRTRSVLTEWFHTMPQLGLAAEKGVFLKWPARLAASCRRDLWREEKSDQPSPGATHESPSNANDDNDIHVHRDDNGTVQVNEADWECLISLTDLSWKDTALPLISAYCEQTDGSWIEDKECAIVWHYELADPEYGRMQASELQKYLIKVLPTPTLDVIRYDYNRILEVKPYGVSKGIAATAILEAVMKNEANNQKTGMGRSVSAASIKSLITAPTAPAVLNPAISVPSQILTTVNPRLTRQSTSPEPSPPTSPRLATEAVPAQPFLLGVGDDRSDEDMFVAINNKDYLKANLRHVDGTVIRPAKEPAATSTGTSSNTTGSDANKDTSAEVDDDEKLPTKKGNPDQFTFTVCVGMKPSSAHYFLHDDEEVLKMLLSLATCSTRMAQTRSADQANLLRQNSLNTLTQMLLGSGPPSSSGNASLGRITTGQANTMSRPQLAPMGPFTEEAKDDDDEEVEYASGSDEEGENVEY